MKKANAVMIANATLPAFPWASVLVAYVLVYYISLFRAIPCVVSEGFRQCRGQLGGILRVLFLAGRGVANRPSFQRDAWI